MFADAGLRWMQVAISSVEKTKPPSADSKKRSHPRWGYRKAEQVGLDDGGGAGGGAVLTVGRNSLFGKFESDIWLILDSGIAWGGEACSR